VTTAAESGRSGVVEYELLVGKAGGEVGGNTELIGKHQQFVDEVAPAELLDPGPDGRVVQEARLIGDHMAKPL
jgi:hypothetical protein